MDELEERSYELTSTETIIYCKAFEDNYGALEIARIPNMCQRTKAINVIYHHLGVCAPRHDQNIPHFHP